MRKPFGGYDGALEPGWTWVDLDLTRQTVRVVRVGLKGRRAQVLAFGDLGSVEVEEEMDSEGGKVWRPAMRLQNGDWLLLSELWSHDQRGVEQVVAVVAEACRVPAGSLTKRISW